MQIPYERKTEELSGHYPEYSVSQDQGQREGSARTRGTDIPNPNLDRRRTFEQQ